MSKVVKVGFIDVDMSEPRAIPARQPRDPVDSLSDDALSEVNAYARSLMEEARQAADVLLERAREQAEQIRLEAEQSAVRIYESARENGQRDGYAAGQEDARQVMETERQRWLEQTAEMMVTVDKQRRELLESLAGPLTEVAMSSVRSLLHRELALSGPDVLGIVQSLLTYVIESTRVEVRVHPDDYAAAAAAHPVWQGQKFGEWLVVVVPDETVSRGGCEIRSDVGRVDARLETKLELLQPVLTEFMQQEAIGFVHAMG